jgi:hypothetical protein
MFANEVSRLKAQGLLPCMKVLEHCDPKTNEIKCCCRAAKASFQSEIISAAMKQEDGVHGVLCHLQQSLVWGVRRCSYLCEMIQSPVGIDCGAVMGLTLFALHQYLEYLKVSPPRMLSSLSSSRPSIRLAAVQIIFRSDPANNCLYHDMMHSFPAAPDNESNIKNNKKEKKNNSSSNSNGVDCLPPPLPHPGASSQNGNIDIEWFTEHLTYHQCLGLYSDNQQSVLRVWDHSHWIPYIERDSDRLLSNGILAIRVTPYHGNDNKTTTEEEESSDPPVVFWEGKLRIPFHQWVDLDHSDQKKTRSGTKLGRITSEIYPLTSKTHLSSSLRKITSTTSTTANPSVVATTHPRHGFLPIKKSNDNNNNSLGEDRVLVYVSACHMGSGPYPGTAVARSLRFWMNREETSRRRGGEREPGGRNEEYEEQEQDQVNGNNCSSNLPKELKLIGVDDLESDPLAGLVDPVFDSTRNLVSLGKMRKKPPAHHHYNHHRNQDQCLPFKSQKDIEKDNLWEVVVDMLYPVSVDKEKTFPFFIPVRRIVSFTIIVLIILFLSFSFLFKIVY